MRDGVPNEFIPHILRADRHLSRNLFYTCWHPHMRPSMRDNLDDGVPGIEHDE